MPQLDGTGPQGQGPKTGRGMGDCATGKADSQPRLGAGRGRGAGRGAGFGRSAAPRRRSVGYGRGNT